VELLIAAAGNNRRKSGAQLGSGLRLLRLTVYQNPMSRGFKKLCVSYDMNGTQAIR
jgi:hypothetical protein